MHPWARAQHENALQAQIGISDEFTEPLQLAVKRSIVLVIGVHKGTSVGCACRSWQ